MFDIAQNKKQLEEQLDLWIEFASQLNFEPLDAFIKTLGRWKTYIAAFATQNITNATTEGLNNFLRYFKRISFGLPNFKHMRLRILIAAT